MKKFNIEEAKSKTPEEVVDIIRSLKGLVSSKSVGWKNCEARIVEWEDFLKDNNITLPTPKPKPEEPFRLIVARKWVQLHESALRRGKEFNLTHSDVRKLLSRKTCTYTGIRFEYTPSECINGVDPYCRTIDRLDPNKGYVKGNVFAITHMANQMKNSLLEDKTSSRKTSLKTLTKFVSTLNKLNF